MDRIFFQDWMTLLRTATVGVLAYLSLLLLIRLSGKRTLSKMNAFDMIVTIALGSTLATILLNRDVSLSEGTLAFGVLVGLQYAITWSSVRIRWVRRLVTGEPTLLLYGGRILPEALRYTRVTESEIHAAVRGAGISTVEDVAAVVLETDGTFSVIRSTGNTGTSSLADVHGLR